MKRHSKRREHSGSAFDKSPASFSAGGIGNSELCRRGSQSNFGAKFLSTVAVAILAICMSSPGLASSQKPERSYSVEGVLKTLSPTTVEALRKDTGVDPFYIMVFTREGPVVIGEAPGVNGHLFTSQKELWEKKDRITVERILPTRSAIRFHASPGLICGPFPPWGVGGSFFDDWTYCPPSQ